MSLEDFLLSSANEEAAAWLVQREPKDWPAHTLVLCGPEGSGKTHLLHIWCDKQKAALIKLGDPVLSQIVQAKAIAPAYAIDDADECAGDVAAQEWLQHFYNATKAAGFPVLLTAKTPPAGWGLTLRDIETRLKSGPSVGLHEPDDELMRGLFLKLFADRQLLVETGVVDYLAARVDRTGSAVKQMVSLLDEAALETGRKISIPFAQKTLAQNEPKPEDNGNQHA